MASQLRVLRINLLTALVSIVLAGCMSQRMEDAAEVVRPKTPPQRDVSSLETAQHCMDEKLLTRGFHDLRLTSHFITDQTKTVSADFTESLKAAVTAIAGKSRGLTYQDGGIGSNLQRSPSEYWVGVLTELRNNNPNALPPFKVPEWYIKGGITAMQRAIAASEGGGLKLVVGVGSGDLGAQREIDITNMTVQLSLHSTLDGSLLETVRNNISFKSQSGAINVTGLIARAGAQYELRTTHNEGLHNSVNALLDLGVIELTGRFLGIDYWTCLAEAAPANAAQQSLTQEPDAVRKAQSVLRALQYYSGPVDGRVSRQLTHDLSRFQLDQSLTSDGRLTPATLARIEVAGASSAGRSQKGGTDGRNGIRIELARRLQDRDLPVQVGTPMQLLISVDRGSWLYCFADDKPGEPVVARLFPNNYQPDAYVPAQRSLQVPPAGLVNAFTLVTEEPGQHAIGCVSFPSRIEPAQLGDLGAPAGEPVRGHSLEAALAKLGRLMPGSATNLIRYQAK